MKYLLCVYGVFHLLLGYILEWYLQEHINNSKGEGSFTILTYYFQTDIQDILNFHSTTNFYSILTGNACYKEKLKSSSKGINVEIISFNLCVSLISTETVHFL